MKFLYIAIKDSGKILNDLYKPEVTLNSKSLVCKRNTLIYSFKVIYLIMIETISEWCLK